MKKLSKYTGTLVAVVLAVLLSAGVMAQSGMITVTGTVTDEQGVPLAGATVLVENTTRGVITDTEGKYQIVAPGKGALVFSFMGYKPKTVALRGSVKINVALEPDVKLLDEVVAVGYGSMKRSDLTGSVSSVSAKAIENYKTATLYQVLGGMIAGVNIISTDGTPGASFDVKIRGTGTVNGDASPLYIVDGFEVYDLTYLSNQDIASVEVLKDASAAAIYGSRGANGVVLVTTKSGKSGRTEVSYNGSMSYRVLSKRLDVLDPYEYVKLQMELNPLRYTNVYYIKGEDAEGNPYKYQTMEDYIGVAGIDWQDVAFRPTWSQNHDLSIRGGNKERQYLLSYSHFDEDGLFPTNTYAKNSLRLKLKQDIYQWLTFDGSFNYANVKITGIGTGGNTLSNILMYRPVGGMNTTEEELLNSTVDPILQQLGITNTSYYNPTVNADKTDQEQNDDQWYIYGSFLFKLTRSLTFKASGAYTLNNSRSDRFFNSGSTTADQTSGTFGNSKMSRSMRYSITNQLTYNNTLGKKHKINAILGQETTYKLSESLYGESKDFPMGDLGVDNLGLGAVPSSVTTSKSDSRRLSYFVRAIYNFDNRYMLTATARADASSVFSENNKWGYFPSFAAAWNLANESFMEPTQWISNLKLRVGWGMVGNDRITNYLSLSLYNNYKYGVGSQQLTTFSPAHLANLDLKWEASMTTNIGLDLGFFDNRLNITTDAFVKDSKDLLLSQELSYVTGFGSQWQNIGKIRNKGIELTINSLNISKRNFAWTTDFNISFIRNTLLALQNGKDYMLSRSGITSTFSEYDYIAEVGKPIGNMYGYVFDGVYQSSDFEVYADGSMHLKEGVVDISDHAGSTVVPGFVKYKDIDGDGVITTNDRTAIGNGQPDWYGGLTNTFRLYGVDVSFMLQFSYGNDVYNAQRMYATQSDLEVLNMRAEVANRWTTTNASNEVPSAKGYVRYDIYSRFIEDGSFVRLKNLTIGYSLPPRWIRKVYLEKCRIYASAQNLFCLTGYSGYDPEVSMSSSNLMPGFDYGAYPKSTVWTFGVELNF